MILENFQYVKPGTLKEATEFLFNHRVDTYVLAGGTDLVVKMHRDKVKPQYLVDIKKISPSLRYIAFDEINNLIRIGSLATFNDLVRSSLINEKIPVLAQAASCVGSRQIRSRGTLAGNLCSALPSADTPPALLVLDARAVLVSKDKERVLPLTDFFKFTRETNMLPGEIMKEIEIPLPHNESRMFYIKHKKRQALDLALVGVAACIELSNNMVSECRIAFATAAPTPIRAYEAEDVLRYKQLPLNDEIIDTVASTAKACASPRTSRRASAEYRLEMIEELTRRVIKNCIF